MSYNNFRNGYTCKECVKNRGWTRRTKTPVYTREDRKFVFAGLVICFEHGDAVHHYAPAIALRDL